MNKQNNRKIPFFIFIAFLFCALILCACTAGPDGDNPINSILSIFTTQTPIPEQIVTGTQTVIPEASPEAIPTQEAAAAAESVPESPTAVPTPEVFALQLWVPPQFDPEQDVPGGNALAAAIAAYTELHPNVTISVRVKAATGDSSMLNTITAASHIAQSTLPTLALISRGTMETMVQRGLIQPITTNIFSDSTTWYSYARQSAAIDNTIYGIPVLGDGLVLTYRTARVGQEMTDWPDILTRGLPIAFAPAVSNSLFGTFIYLSLGGKLTNDQGQPYLDQQKLTDTLNFFLTGGQNGAFPPSLGQLVDQNQAWQRFADGTMSLIVSQFSTFRHYQDTQIYAMALPTPQNYLDYPLVNTWNLVLVKNDPVIQQTAVDFAEYLADITVNDQLSLSAGYLPVRNSAHESWANDPIFERINPIVENAALIPNNQISNKLIPIINNAVAQVVRNQQTPEAAALEAVEGLN